MRHIRRKRRPDIFSRPEIAQVRDALAEFHREGGTRETQKALDFEYVFAPIRELVEVDSSRVFGPTFRRWCAYTEQELTRSELVLHRPPRDALGLDETVSPHHYYWLATEWTNWYQADAEVARRKGPFFPVAGARARLPEADTDRRPRRDRGLLLEPCHDHPQWWLRAQPDGTWAPASHPADGQRYGDSPNRGDLTIEVLGLNDKWLVEERRTAVAALPQLLSSGLESVSAEQRRDLLGPGPFAGFRRQIAAQEALRVAAIGRPPSAEDVIRLGPELIPLLLDRGEPVPPFLREVGEDLLAVAERIGAGRAGRQALETLLEGRPMAAGADVAVAEEVDDREPPHAPEQAGAGEGAARGGTTIRRDAYIATIEIRNFRCIDHVEIDLTGDHVTVGREIQLDDDGAVARPPAAKSAVQGGPPGRLESQVVPSAAFLGENGSGKSTILQAVAVALAGGTLDQVLADAGLTWADLLRRGTGEGRIVLTFGRGEQIVLSFTAAGHAFDGGPPAVNLLVRAFGASRTLAATPTSDERDAVEVTNLFDATSAIIDSDGWLAELNDREDPSAFNVASSTIREFLELPEEGQFAFTDEGLVVDGTPLRLLSDGYKSVVTLLCATMAGSGLETTDTRSIRGVVLIDEIGAHLHPRWRMHITRRLRAVFPQVQFLISTHEPLCLRGMRGHEVVRVWRTGADAPATLEVVERSPSEYRVDQLLTSEFFGLGTTIDPDEQRRWDEYYAALASYEAAKRADPNDPRLATLAADVQRLRGLAPTHGVLGATRRDQLAYEVIDRYLAREPRLSPEERRDARRAAIAEAADLYRVAVPGRPGGTTP